MALTNAEGMPDNLDEGGKLKKRRMTKEERERQAQDFHDRLDRGSSDIIPTTDLSQLPEKELKDGSVYGIDNDTDDNILPDREEWVRRRLEQGLPLVVTDED